MRKKSLIRLWSHLPSRVWRILRAPQVSLLDKLLFVIPVLVYWVMPDFMPFLPIDDIAVTALVAGWFAARMERKYSMENDPGNQYNRTRP